MWYIDLLFFISPSTLISPSAFISPSAHRLHLLLHSPILFLLPSSPLLYCLPVLKKKSPSISFLPSLIYPHKIWFFFPPFGSLCPLFYRRQSGSFLSVLVVLSPKIPAAHWERGDFQSSWSLIPTTRNGAKTELDSNGPKTELDSNGLVLFFSDCDRRGRRRLGCGSLLSGLFFPFWFASSLCVVCCVWICCA